VKRARQHELLVAHLRQQLLVAHLLLETRHLLAQLVHLRPQPRDRALDPAHPFAHLEQPAHHVEQHLLHLHHRKHRQQALFIFLIFFFLRFSFFLASLSFFYKRPHPVHAPQQ
jgi:hypothetical protein